MTAALLVAVYCLIGYLWYKVERGRHPDQFEDEGDDPSDDGESSVDWWFGLIWPLCLWFQFGDWLNGPRKRH
jgi:hypothetical protein